MSRRSSAFARAICVIAALVLLCAGGAAIAWQRNVGGVRNDVTTYPDTTAWPDASWWPWALGAFAGVAGLLALVMLALLVARPRVGTWTLSGSGPEGALTADVFAAASAAAQVFETYDDVHRASYSVRSRDGICLIDLTLLCSGDADLDLLDRAARADARTFEEALGGPLAQRVFVQIERSH